MVMNTQHHKKPIIGVTGPERGGWPMWFFTRLAVWRAGGKALRITPKRPATIDGLDGLILGGGADVSPALYDGDPDTLGEAMRQHRAFSLSQKLTKIILFPLLYALRRVFSTQRQFSGEDKDRDQLESHLLRQALRANLPVLGICRGAQLINVFFNGTLHQNLNSFYTETPKIRSIFPKKVIQIAADSQLATLLQQQRCAVNALHDQAVQRAGDQVRFVAWESSGVVQALEHTELPFVIGVQWHPEFLPHYHRQQHLFQALVKQAKQCATRDFMANGFST